MSGYDDDDYYDDLVQDMESISPSRRISSAPVKSKTDTSDHFTLGTGNEGSVVVLGYANEKASRRQSLIHGVRLAPFVIRKYLPAAFMYAYNPEYGVDLNINGNLISLGECTKGDAGLDASQKEIYKWAKKLFRKRQIPLVVGGSHDVAVPVSQALSLYCSEGLPWTIINIGCELGVQVIHEEKSTSGNVIRQILEHKDVHNCSPKMFAAQGIRCGANDALYAKHHGSEITWLKDIRARAKHESAAEIVQTLINRSHDYVYVAFNMQSIAVSDAPGVSVISNVGLSAEDAVEIMLVAGRSLKVRCVSVSEFNPNVEEERTATLIASMIYHFATGHALQFREAERRIRREQAERRTSLSVREDGNSVVNDHLGPTQNGSNVCIRRSSSSTNSSRGKNLEDSRDSI
eukprot:Clim_evm43s210 gene=Clim_evmTU43s210